MYAYKEMFNWRDKVARTEDESLAYVLPPHMLLKICTELPREMQGILACCNPVPPLVKQNLNQLHEIILKARDQPLVGEHYDDIILIFMICGIFVLVEVLLLSRSYSIVR